MVLTGVAYPELRLINMNSVLDQAMDDFILRYQESPSADELLQIEYDSSWPSPCYRQHRSDGDLVGWAPVMREIPGDFKGIETALEMKIHPDVVSFYGRYWSDNLNAETKQGKLQLLQAWNEADFERLQENLIGHIMMKRRLKQADTLFFALTDEEDFILTIDNSSGAVLLEQIGLVAKETLTPNLSSFFKQLQPSNSKLE
jgi:SecY interacting protein Syd